MSAISEIPAYMVSPCCHAGLQFHQERLVCESCGLGYPMRGDIQILLKTAAGRFCERCRRWRHTDTLADGRCPDCLDTI